MAIPDYETLMLPVLRLTAEGFERIPQMLPRLKSEFSLWDEDMQELLPSGRTPVLAQPCILGAYVHGESWPA